MQQTVKKDPFAKAREAKKAKAAARSLDAAAIDNSVATIDKVPQEGEAIIAEKIAGVVFNTYPEPVKEYDDWEDKQVWLKGLLAGVSATQANHQSKIAACIPIADAVLAAFKKKFK